MREWLIKARKEKLMSQTEVAKQVGISQPSYCDIENGKISPKPSNAHKIADILNVEWTRFYEQ